MLLWGSIFSVVLELHAMKDLVFVAHIREHPIQITMRIFKQLVRGEGSAQWPTATSICVTVGLCMFSNQPLNSSPSLVYP